MLHGALVQVQGYAVCGLGVVFMAKLFSLKVLTPEREFYNGDAEAVTVPAPDGLFTILAGHTPIIMPLVVGTIRIKKDGIWQMSVNSEGFMEVSSHEVLIFVQACEYPEEIDTRRAEEARRRAEEQLRQKQSMGEYQQNKLALARAMARLRVTRAREELRE